MCLAIPGLIEAITDDDGPAGPLARRGQVRFGSLRKEVSLAFVPEAGLGDYVLVHVGVALQRLDPAEAERTLEALDRLAELGELGEEGAPAGPGSGS